MRGGYTPSKSYSDISVRTGKRNQRHAYCPIENFKLTCLIHGSGHYSEQFGVLKHFGERYNASRTIKYSIQESIIANKTPR